MWAALAVALVTGVSHHVEYQSRAVAAQDPPAELEILTLALPEGARCACLGQKGCDCSAWGSSIKAASGGDAPVLLMAAVNSSERRRHTTPELFAEKKRHHFPPKDPKTKHGWTGDESDIPATMPSEVHVQNLFDASGETNMSSISVTVSPDGFPSETSWKLVQLAAGSPEKTLLGVRRGELPEHTTKWTKSVPGGTCYKFIIYDQSGDGICCDRGSGYFELRIDGKLVKRGGRYETMDMVPVCAPQHGGAAVTWDALGE